MKLLKWNNGSYMVDEKAQRGIKLFTLSVFCGLAATVCCITSITCLALSMYDVFILPLILAVVCICGCVWFNMMSNQLKDHYGRY